MSEIIGSDSKKLLIRDNKKFVIISREDYTKIDEFIDAGYDNKSELIPVKKAVGVDDWYGFIDKCGNESVPLIYDHVWNFDNSGYARVKRFGHIHIVDTNSNLFFSKSFFINNHLPMLSKEESITTGFYYDSFKPVKIDNLWGWRYDADGEIYDNVYDRFCSIIHTNDCKYISYRKNGLCELHISSENTQKKYSFNADYIEPLVDYGGNYLDDTGTYHLNEDNCNYIIAKTNHKYGIVNVNGENIIPSEYDLILACTSHLISFDWLSNRFETNGFILKKNDKYGIANLEGKIILPIEYDKIEYIDAKRGDYTGEYLLICLNNLYSILRIKDGEILFPFKYEEITTTDADNNNGWQIDSLFLVKENGKYGCISFDNRTILDAVYDSISYNLVGNLESARDYFIVEKDGKFGTYENGFCIETNYDECIMLFNVENYSGFSDVAVRLNNKWGLIHLKPHIGMGYPSFYEIDFKYNSFEELENDLISKGMLKDGLRKINEKEQPSTYDSDNNNIIDLPIPSVAADSHISDTDDFDNLILLDFHE